MTMLAERTTMEGAVVEPQTLRRVFGHYPTGVSIVTGIGDRDEPIGLTIGSFNSVSLDPPLVAFYAAKTSKTFEELKDRDSFVVNVLGAGQDHYCRAFGRPRNERFSGITWRPGVMGAPILDDTVAWIECSMERIEEAGDHYWVLGRVLALDIGKSTKPLVFVQGKFESTSMQNDPRMRWYVDLTEQL